jgi:hypothetical protein
VEQRVPPQMEWIGQQARHIARLAPTTQLNQGLETMIGEGLVAKRPETEASLQLRGGGGQKHEMDALWHHDLTTLMPACEGPAQARCGASGQPQRLAQSAAKQGRRFRH